MGTEYRNEVNRKTRIKTNEVLERLPLLCSEFFAGRELRLTEKTMLAYARDFEGFFRYLTETKEEFLHYDIHDFQVEDLAKVDATDISWFIRLAKERGNQSRTIERRLSSISTLFEFYIKQRRLDFNPVNAVDRAKVVRKEVIRMDTDEKARFLETVRSGHGLSGRSQKWHGRNGTRDYAIMMLFLSSGMRVSELVGINIGDINYDECYVSIIRKGGKYDEVFFSDSTAEALRQYQDIRNQYHPSEKEKAFFLSNRGVRIAVGTVEVMTKKYAAASIPGKADKITPHKMRSTFATDYIRATNDIWGTAEALGHESIQTTTIYTDRTNKKKERRNLV